MTLDTREHLTDLQRELLTLLADFGPSPSTVLHSSVSGTVSYPKLMRNLERLASFGLVEEAPRARRTAWRLTGASAHPQP